MVGFLFGNVSWPETVYWLSLVEITEYKLPSIMNPQSSRVRRDILTYITTLVYEDCVIFLKYLFNYQQQSIQGHVYSSIYGVFPDKPKVFSSKKRRDKKRSVVE